MSEDELPPDVEARVRAVLRRVVHRKLAARLAQPLNDLKATGPTRQTPTVAIDTSRRDEHPL